MRSIASLSKLTSVLLGVLIDSTGGLVESQEISDAFRNMASKIERDWVASQLSTAENEDAIAPDTKGLSKTIWTLLKTFFFSTIMIAEGALDSVVYTEPQHPEPQSSSPHTLAESTIHALAHLSFVISQFGGVTAMGTSDEPGFTELRKVFYLAVDVLCSEEDAVPTEVQENRCEAFTRELVQQLTVFEGRKNITQSLKNAKAAYTLACIEQLIPLLRDPCLKEYVWSVCVPYLSDPTDRATYESAHSVILSIFASHARQHPNHTHLAPNHGATSFVHQIVPFYAQCLIENSKEGSLSTSQLRLAYAALVRGASSNGGDNLAWYCITLIIDTIRSLSSTLAGAGAKDEKQRTQLHRLHLTLISTIPSLPLPLMLLALDEILVVLKDLHATEEDGAGEKGRGKELVEALFKELLEGVGDREKEAAMRWWYDHREELELGSPVAATREGEKLVEARL